MGKTKTKSGNTNYTSGAGADPLDNEFERAFFTFLTEDDPTDPADSDNTD